MASVGAGPRSCRPVRRHFGSNLTTVDPALPASAAGAVAIVRQDASSNLAGRPFRVRVDTDDEDAIPPNSGHLLGIEQIAGDSPFHLQRVEDLLLGNQEWRLWQLLDVKYVISRKQLGDGLDYLGHSGDLRVYRMQWAVPRVWATRDIRVVANAEAALSQTFATNVEPGKVALLETAPGLAFPTNDRPEQSFAYRTYDPQYSIVDVNLGEDALLVTSEAYYPGWRAFVDGRETDILRADYYLRAVPMPAGSHELEFVFEPLSFKVGAAISLATLLVVLLLVGTSARGVRS
ncbi:MAG: YfhO family protein [Dehalococcoidales bacterium]|nr:YfhO family protein [Dehalococcoidales bacterium]